MVASSTAKVSVESVEGGVFFSSFRVAWILFLEFDSDIMLL